MESKSLTSTINKQLKTTSSKKISLVVKLKEYLNRPDPKRNGTLGDRLIEKYYSMAKEGDPIIMRDLINRIDGLPKQTIVSDKDNPININVIHSLFGNSIRTLDKPNTEYQHIDTTDTDND
jgi:hypothetical protein